MIVLLKRDYKPSVLPKSASDLLEIALELEDSPQGWGRRSIGSNDLEMSGFSDNFGSFSRHRLSPKGRIL